MADLGEEVRAESELVELRRALHRAQRAAAAKDRKTAEMVEAVYAAARDAALAVGPPPPVTAPPRDTRKGRPEVALLHLTDWQLGKRTSSFDIDVCRQRVMRAVAKAAELADIQRTHHPVRECVVMLGGDMLEGIGIFPGQVYEVEAWQFEQVFECAALIAAAVRQLLASFTTVTVYEEIGNHGRLGRKGDMPYGDNLDRMAYTIARQQIGKSDRVEWHPWAGDFCTQFAIGNYRVMLAHGDEIKSFGGNVPAFGILRKANAWASGVVAPFDDLYLGHYHTPMTLTLANGGRVFVTGSPESDNTYAKEFVAATGRPSQRLHFVDPERGRVTAEYVLWLED